MTTNGVSDGKILAVVPAPTVLWYGEVKRHGEPSPVPMRVVRKWVNASGDNGKTWSRKADIVVEESTGRDAMESPLWRTVAQYNLPREFWVACFPEENTNGGGT